MIRVVYKYPLKFEDDQEVILPGSSKLLCVQAQGKGAQLWALVVPGNIPEQSCVRLRIVATGKEFDYDERWSYFGTFQLFEGRAVFHVFVR